MAIIEVNYDWQEKEIAIVEKTPMLAEQKLFGASFEMPSPNIDYF